MKIRDLLAMRQREPVAIGPEGSVAEAIQKLNRFDRGALPVVNRRGELIGIISERDIIRKCFNAEGQGISCNIKDVMTAEVAVAFPDDDLEYAIRVMQQKRIRHLPVTENRRVVGMVSMRDVLDVQLTEVEAEIRYIGLLPKRTSRPLI